MLIGSLKVMLPRDLLTVAHPFANDVRRFIPMIAWCTGETPSRQFLILRRANLGENLGSGPGYLNRVEFSPRNPGWAEQPHAIGVADWRRGGLAAGQSQ